jgi:hypothetical protein
MIVNADTLNVYLPETDATYWKMDYYLETGRKLVIRGIYPFARFFEFTTYDGDGNPIDNGSIVDKQIKPERGSRNPFRTRKASDNLSERRYRVVIKPHADPSNNAVSGLPGGVTAGDASLIYRLYVPDDPRHLKGDVGLPKITDVDASGVKTRLLPCKRTQSPAASGASIVAAPAGTEAASPCPPGIVFNLHSAASLYPNPANKYVLAEACFHSGLVVVVTGNGPTFPDTRAGQSVTGASDMRYWSICQNLNMGTYPVVDCKADYEIPLTPGRGYTVVISGNEDRPSNATTAHGVAWLPWGDHSQMAIIVLRNMLPDGAFCCSVQKAIALGQPVDVVMGPYYPHAKYCTTAGFESDGAACAAQTP